MIKKIEFGDYIIDEIPKKGVCFIEANIDKFGYMGVNTISDMLYRLLNLIYHGDQMYLPIPFIRIYTEEYILEINIKDDRIVKETIYSPNNELWSCIEPNYPFVMMYEGILDKEWFNFEKVLCIDPPEYPWQKSIFLENGIKLEIDTFKNSKNTKLSKNEKVKELMVNLGFADNISNGWTFFEHENSVGMSFYTQGSGTQYAAYLLSMFFDSEKDTIITFDPYIKKLHYLVERKIYELFSNSNKQILVFGGIDDEIKNVKRIFINTKTLNNDEK